MVQRVAERLGVPMCELLGAGDQRERRTAALVLTPTKVLTTSRVAMSSTGLPCVRASSTRACMRSCFLSGP